MKRNERDSLRRKVLCLLSVFVACFGWCSPVEARATEDKLAKQVKLRLGTTTLEKVMAALSDQSGLKVEASEYLRERCLIVEMDRISVRAALDSLAELYDWEWREWKPNCILVTRRYVPLPRQVAQIPSALQAAFPKDFRRFLGVGTTLDDYAAMADPSVQKQVESVRRRSLFPEKEVSFLVLPRKMQTVLKQSQLWLFDRLRSRLLAGQKLRFTDLSSEERERLVAALAYKRLMNLYVHYDVLNNKLPIYMVDMTTLEVQTKPQVRSQGLGITFGSTFFKDNKKVFVGGGIGLNPDPKEPESPVLNKTKQ